MVDSGMLMETICFRLRDCGRRPGMVACDLQAEGRRHHDVRDKESVGADDQARRKLRACIYGPTLDA